MPPRHNKEISEVRTPITQTSNSGLSLIALRPAASERPPSLAKQLYCSRRRYSEILAGAMGGLCHLSIAG